MLIIKRESYKQNELDQLAQFTQWAIEFMEDEICPPDNCSCSGCQFRNLCRDLVKLNGYLIDAKPIQRR